MGVPARLQSCMALLALAAASTMVGAAASDRFVPTDPGFVVADLGRARPDDALRALIADARANPDAEAPAVALAGALIRRARDTREPRYFGRAEAVLAPFAVEPQAGAAARRLYSETLQFRHDFTGAAALLDQLLHENGRDTDARLRRASLRLTRGDFAGARADCALLAAAGVEAAVGFSCLAQALAGSGEMSRAKALLDAVPSGAGTSPPAHAYLLATRAELQERSDDLAAAVDGYRAALRLAPADDSVRAALADALAQQGRQDEARSVLQVERPSLALLVRLAALASGAEREALILRAQDWLALEAARGDAVHERESAMLEIARGAPVAALAAARSNFRVQRELADVRVLARAIVLAGDERARADLRRWLDDTRYQDSLTEAILGAQRRG